MQKYDVRRRENAKIARTRARLKKHMSRNAREIFLFFVNRKGEFSRTAFLRNAYTRRTNISFTREFANQSIGVIYSDADSSRFIQNTHFREECISA